MTTSCGKIDANAAEQEFSQSATRLAKLYVDAFAVMDADKTLSEVTKKAMKKGILASDAPDPKLFSKGIVAGKTIKASVLKQALDNKMPREGLSALLNERGEKINEALQAQYTPEEWSDLAGDKPAEFRATQGAAFLAMLESVPGLREALGAHADILEMRHDRDMHRERKRDRQPEGRSPGGAEESRSSAGNPYGQRAFHEDGEADAVP